MDIDRLVREPERRQLTGIPTSSWYELIEVGLAPPGVKITERATAWPLSELSALNAARIAGKTDDDIRKLVARLVFARTQAFDGKAA